MSPEYLYKYMSFEGKGYERIQYLLLSNEIYFPSAAQFNDPFDCYVSPRLIDGTDKEWKNYLESRLPSRNPDKNPGQINQMVEQIISEGRFKRNDVRDSVLGNLQELIHRVGILCLSKNPSNGLMWSHYAGSHKGLCICFEHHNEPFFGRAQEITYSSNFPQVSRIRDDDEKIMNAVLLTKASFWSYEEEWRIIDYTGKPGMKRFPSHLLTGVIFGLQMTRNDREQIIQWGSMRKKELKFYEVARSDGGYGFQIRPYPMLNSTIS